MDKNKIIEDGLLELYLLGELSLEDEERVIHALKSDPEVMRTFKKLEEDFEHMAFENAVKPPKSVRKALENEVDATISKTEVRSLGTPKKKEAQTKFRLLVAASLAALFALTSFWLYTNWQSAIENTQMVQDQVDEMKKRLNELEGNYEENENKYQKIAGANVIPLLLMGNDRLPQSKAIAYVNHISKEVVVNTQGLPELAKDKTYQMWADVDGEMINMGIVASNKELLALDYIENAESLNITIEPAGGSDHPTVENLISNVFL